MFYQFHLRMIEIPVIISSFLLAIFLNEPINRFCNTGVEFLKGVCTFIDEEIRFLDCRKSQ